MKLSLERIKYDIYMVVVGAPDDAADLLNSLRFFLEDGRWLRRGRWAGYVSDAIQAKYTIELSPNAAAAQQVEEEEYERAINREVEDPDEW